MLKPGDSWIIQESAFVNFYFLQNSFRRCERHALSNNQCLFRRTVSATVNFYTSCIHVDHLMYENNMYIVILLPLEAVLVY